MIHIGKGIYNIWNNFHIRLDCDLDLTANHRYVFVGDNGSGKSSFVRQIILPNVMKISDDNNYLFYIDQEFLIQYHAIQAHSCAYSFMNGINKSIIKSYKDAIYYMYDFYKNNINGKRNLIMVLDETELYTEISHILEEAYKSCSILIVITHNKNIINEIDNPTVITFEKYSENESILRLN